MKKPWFFSGIVLLLFAFIVLGIPLWPQLLAVPVLGRFNLGMLTLLALHVTPVVLAVIYIRGHADSAADAESPRAP